MTDNPITQTRDRLHSLVGYEMICHVMCSKDGPKLFERGLFKGKCLMIVRTTQGAYFEILKDKKLSKKKT